MHTIALAQATYFQKKKGFLKSATLFILTARDIYTKLLTFSELLVKIKFRLIETVLVIFFTLAVISK